MTEVTRVIKNMKCFTSSNGNRGIKIAFEDQREHEMPLEFYGDDKILLVMKAKKVGDSLTVDSSGKWAKFVVTEEEFKPKVSKIDENILKLIAQKDEDREIVSKEFLCDEFETWLEIDNMFVDKAYKFYTNEKNKTQIAKSIRENLELAKAKQALDPWSIIFSKANQFRKESERKYVPLMNTPE